MWKLLFLIIATVAASDFEEGCRGVIRDECEKDSPDFPGSEKELEEFCKIVLNYFECADKLKDQCEQEDEVSFVQDIQELNTVFNQICNKDTLLYSALAASLHCIKNEMMQISVHCRTSMEESLQSFSEILSSSEITDIEETENDEGSVSCMEILYGTSCFVSRIGKFCGNVARDAALEIVQGLDRPFTTCRAGVKQNIPTIVQVMQLEAEKEEDVESVIKKKKK